MYKCIYILYIHIWSILTLSNPEALRRAVPALSAASRLIHFEAHEDANLADLHLPLELDVDQVWPGFHGLNHPTQNDDETGFKQGRNEQEPGQQVATRRFQPGAGI